MGTKVENYAAMFARNTARQRGRNEDWAENAVRKSVMIGDREALQSKVIEIVAANISDLLKQCDGRIVTIGDHRVTLHLKDAMVRERSMTFGQSVLDTIADPNIVYLLLMAGLLGLYFEFAHPGVYFPGVAGAICLLLALASFQVLPVTLSGLLLIFLGAPFVVPSFLPNLAAGQISIRFGFHGPAGTPCDSLCCFCTSNRRRHAHHSIWRGRYRVVRRHGGLC